MTNRIAVLAAGGTAGHLYPAEALAVELAARGWKIHLYTDSRAERYSANFAAAEIHVIRSAAPGGGNPFRLVGAGYQLVAGYLESRHLLARSRPDIVIGFGGYPTVPPLLAAQHTGIPNMIHDANAVMGRANRLLARRARLVAMGFEGMSGENVVVTGNPVRPAVTAAALIPYRPRRQEEPLDLLIFGGSQGAQFFGDAIPAAVELLEPDFAKRLRIVQQVRPEQSREVARRYEKLGMEAQLAPFFENMAERMAEAHLVLCRAGASSVSELCVIGRPALLVPYPHALDHDQASNAASFAATGGATVIEQATLSPEKLAQILKNAICEPQRLAQMAEKAKKAARPDAARRLADCAEEVADGRMSNQGESVPTDT